MLSTFVTQMITTMNTRLKQFIAAENLTQAQLADKINVVRASVSHILSGRNKPSYEFISGLMRHYPDLNIEWLMFGKGKMYRQSPVDAVPAEEPVEIHEEPKPQAAPEPEIIETNTLATLAQDTINQRKLIKIVAFFDDGTFQELMA